MKILIGLLLLLAMVVALAVCILKSMEPKHGATVEEDTIRGHHYLVLKPHGTDWRSGTYVHDPDCHCRK